MNVICPYCSHGMTVKSAKPGRYKPKCAKCTRLFLLTVGDDESAKTAALPDAADPNATAPPAAPKKKVAAPDPDKTAPPTVNPDVTTAPVMRKASPVRPPAAKKPAAPDLTTAPEEEAAANPDVTTAPEEEALAKRRKPANPDATAAPDGTDMEDADDEGEPTETGDDEDEERDPSMPDKLGPFEVVKMLGEGGMGAVYLARQVSLDRPVALKVMKPEWASNPNFLVRFTREAYAAAQLLHHNVVQVYDIGTDQGINYFSMEFVEGTSLGNLVKVKGKLEPKAAVGYILQAARGLKFAHDRGMVHRDVKPDNLMVNTQGIVKVADLGLVRTPGSIEEKPNPDAEEPTPKKGKRVASQGTLTSLGGVTMVNQAMGTPSYMAPEQARDATSVDERADIYSLGCTLYVLVTGQTVFEGKTAFEMMDKQMNAPVTPPEVRNKAVPAALSAIIMKSLAKKPEDRYRNTGAFIDALEGYLGVADGADALPGEEQAEVLDQGAKAFRDIPTARLRSRVLTGFFLLCAVGFVLCLVLGSWVGAGSSLGLGFLTAAAYFVVNGMNTRSHLFLKARAYVLGFGVFDWIKLVLGVLLVLGILYFVGLLWAWLGVCVAAVALAYGFHFALDRKVEARREGALEGVEKLLKGLRLKGVSEEAIQQFVCKFGGERWEDVYEALFGYEAKLAARARWGAGPKGPRPKHAAWRDPLLRWIDARQRDRQEARERKHLQAVEKDSLRAGGMSAAEADEQAEQAAEAMVQMAAEIKQEAAQGDPDATTAPDGEERIRPPRKRINLRAMYEVASRPTQARPRKSRLLEKLDGFVFGGQLRFLLGAVLLFVCLAWLHVRTLTAFFQAAPLYEPKTWEMFWTAAAAAKPLEIPLVPALVLAPLSSLAAGVAGLLLILSAFQSLRWLALFHMAVAAVMILGPTLGVPEVGPLGPALACLAGGAALSPIALVVAWRMQR